MTQHATTHATLASAVWPSDRTGALLRNAILVVLGSALLWASAKIQIPFYPVPMTMQTFMVLVLGMAYGWRLGAATLGLYLLEGAFGLPVFAGTPEKGIGLAYIAGPTGGYLVGFLLAAMACGWLAKRGWDRSVAKTAAAMLVGNVFIYVPGLLWLGTVVGWDKPVLAWGLTPFLLGEMTKLALAAVLLPAIWKRVRQI
jgi:biotin transport system substrate-specific component